MSNEETSHIMFVGQQVLRFAAEKLHKHRTSDIEDIETNYSKNRMPVILQSME